MCNDASLSDLLEGRNKHSNIKIRMAARMVTMATRSPLLKENHLRKDSILYSFGPFDRLKAPLTFEPVEMPTLYLLIIPLMKTIAMAMGAT